MDITAEDYEWVLATVEALHRTASTVELRKELLTCGARIGARGWLEADAAGRWLKCEAGEVAPWCGASLPLPRRREQVLWRSSGSHAMALRWMEIPSRWIGWWMSPVPTEAETLARKLMPALGTAYDRVARRDLERRAGLTSREAEVTGWIAEGKTDLEVARILGISEHTVGKHRDNIFTKVGVGNRASLVRWVHG